MEKNKIIRILSMNPDGMSYSQIRSSMSSWNESTLKTQISRMIKSNEIFRVLINNKYTYFSNKNSSEIIDDAINYVNKLVCNMSTAQVIVKLIQENTLSASELNFLDDYLSNYVPNLSKKCDCIECECESCNCNEK